MFRSCASPKFQHFQLPGWRRSASKQYPERHGACNDCRNEGDVFARCDSHRCCNEDTTRESADRGNSLMCRRNCRARNHDEDGCHGGAKRNSRRAGAVIPRRRAHSRHHLILRAHSCQDTQQCDSEKQPHEPRSYGGGNQQNPADDTQHECLPSLPKAKERATPAFRSAKANVGQLRSNFDSVCADIHILLLLAH